jgi:hypothetical protein
VLLPPNSEFRDVEPRRSRLPPPGAASGHSFSIRIRQVDEVCLRGAIHSDTRPSHETGQL